MLRSFCLFTMLGLASLALANDTEPAEQQPSQTQEATTTDNQDQQQSTENFERPAPDEADPQRQTNPTVTSRPADDQQGGTDAGGQMGPPAPIQPTSPIRRCSPPPPPGSGGPCS